MTTKPTAPDAAAPAPVKQFPELPPRDDMNNPLYLHDPGHQPALRRHLGNPTTTIVISEIPVGWRYNQPQGLLKSDLLVAFDIDRAAIVAQAGYSILDWGKPPDFVLENRVQKHQRTRRNREARGLRGVWCAGILAV